jgi:hypothetical protein
MCWDMLSTLPDLVLENLLDYLVKEPISSPTPTYASPVTFSCVYVVVGIQDQATGLPLVCRKRALHAAFLKNKSFPL